MTDRELLEAAAKAAGLTIEYWAQPNYPIVRDGNYKVGWQPLIFDSDALRLAVTLEMDVFVRAGRWSEAVCPMGPAVKESHGADPYAATRRAIVRAAAAMADTVSRTGDAP